MAQHTVNESIKISGIGAHSGKVHHLEIRPAPANCGIVFHRTDLGEYIKADYNNVVDTQLCSVIANPLSPKARVSTIEHLMSAFSALGVDNAIVALDGEEVPILDGSSIKFVEAIERVGLCEQTAPRKLIKVLKPVRIEDGDKFLELRPADTFSLSVEIDFKHPLINKQTCQYTEQTSFKNQIAAARTFGFVEDVEKLRSIGLAKGSSVDNAVALTKDGMLNEELRFVDEFVRHKMLDCIGDFYLGGNIVAEVVGFKVGHSLNNQAMHALFADASNYEIVLESEEDAASLIPTPPFLSQLEAYA